ncbi:MAG TPA: Uma2 family endonuclease [Acetobacteraceae bacterium]|nr:Uma2 family endonuclease [Acetobacteraceae bacterium]
MRPSALTHEPETMMTREQYRAWAEQQPQNRFERHHGIVIAMAPERAGHALRKAAARDELLRGVRAASLPCQVFPDGMTIEIDDSDYEPDAVLRCGPRLPDDAIAIPDPLVIVEVLSPGTSAIDRGHKLRAYLRVASLRHYLIVWPDTPRVVHHHLAEGGKLATEVFTEGEIQLDPPGIRLEVAALYAD